jgi:hypothetical protein
LGNAIDDTLFPAIADGLKATMEASHHGAVPALGTDDGGYLMFEL